MSGRGARIRAGVRTAVRVALRAVWALILVAVLAAGGAYSWLQSPAGTAWFGAQVVAGINARISGRLTATSARVHGLSLDLSGLVLRDRAGEVVARVGSLAGLRLPPLLLHRLVLDGARVVGLDVEVDLAPGREPPLLAALSPPPPQAAGAGAGARDGSARGGGARGGGGGGGSGFTLRELWVSGARLRIRQALNSSAPAVAVVSGVDGRVLHGREWSVELGGTVEAPLQGPLRLGLSTSRAVGGAHALSLRLELPGLGADIGWRPRAGPGRLLTVERLAVAPAAGRALWARWPLASAVALSGRVAMAPDGWDLSLGGQGPAGALSVNGRYLPATRTVPRLEVRVNGLDLRALLGVGPATDLRGSASASGALGAGVRFAVQAAGAIAGIPVRSLRAEGRAGGGAAAVATLAAAIPGATAEGRASLGGGQVEVGIHAVAADLAAATAALAPLTRARLPLAGAGALELSVRGPESAPAFALTAWLGGRPVLTASGRRTPPGATLGALAFRLAGSRWTLQGPVQLRADGGAVSLSPVVLRSGGQRIGIEGALEGGQVSARTSVRSLDLARLRAGFPSLPALTGRLTGTLSVAGPQREPVVSADVRVRGGPVPALAAGSLRLRAALSGSPGGPTVRGSADLRAVAIDGARGALRLDAIRTPGGTRATGAGSIGGGRVDLALDLAGGGSSPVRLAGGLRVERVDAGAILAAVPGVRSASGRLDGALRVQGTLPSPQVYGQLSWRGGAVATRGYGTFRDVELAARADGAGLRIGSFSVRSGGGWLAGSAELARGAAGLTVRARAQLASFPVVSGNTLHARVDGAVELSAIRAGGRVRGEVGVCSAQVRLPARTGRPVQPTRPPGDVLVVARDAPVRRWGAEATAVPSGAEPERWPVPPDPELELSVRSCQRVLVRGPAFDLHASFGRDLRIVRAGRLAVFGALEVPSGVIVVLGNPVALLGGSELRFVGPPARPYLALAVRGGFEPEAVVVISGQPGLIHVGLPPRGTTQAQVFAALARSGPETPPLLGAVPLVGVTVPFAQLLRAPAGSSYVSGVPLTSRLRVGTEGRLGAEPRRGENTRSAWVDLRLGGQLRLEARGGDAGSNSLDLLWPGAREPAAATGAAKGRQQSP